MEVLIVMGIVYLWFILAGYYSIRIIRKLKGFQNILLNFIRYLFAVSVITIPMTLIPIEFVKYLLVIYFSFTTLLANVLQKNKLVAVDLLATISFTLVGIAETILKMNVFLPLGIVYLVLYTVYYASLRSDVIVEIKKAVITISVVISTGIGVVSTLSLLNIAYLQVIVGLPIILSSVASYLVVLLSYTRTIDTLSNDVTAVVLEKSNKIKDFTSRMEEIVLKLKDCYSSLELSVDKIEKNKVQEFVKELISSVMELSPIVEFIQRTIKDYQNRVEKMVKDLPALSENFARDFSELMNTRQALSETNTNVMSLVKVALDSERAVMNASKSIRELRATARNLTDNLKVFGEISEHSSILSINISVEASKLGSKGEVFSKLSQQAKKFSDLIYSNVETTKRLITELDSKAEFSEHMVKTLVMSFVEMETGLKNISKGISMILEKFENLSTTAENIRKGIEEIDKMMFMIPEFSMEISKRGEDILLNYKKLRKYSDDILVASNSVENSVKSIVESIKSTMVFVENLTK
ncbi:MAG: methyl-accepting chemotaxis protein [Brevinematia bacterium]